MRQGLGWQVVQARRSPHGGRRSFFVYSKKSVMPLVGVLFGGADFGELKPLRNALADLFCPKPEITTDSNHDGIPKGLAPLTAGGFPPAPHCAAVFGGEDMLSRYVWSLMVLFLAAVWQFWSVGVLLLGRQVESVLFGSIIACVFWAWCCWAYWLRKRRVGLLLSACCLLLSLVLNGLCLLDMLDKSGEYFGPGFLG